MNIAYLAPEIDKESVILKKKKNRFLLRLGLLILLLNVLVGGLLTVSLLKSRSMYEERAALVTKNLTMLLDEGIHGVIDKLDLCLTSVQYEAEKNMTGQTFDKRSLDPFIQRIHSMLPELESIRIADADGNVIIGIGVVKPVNITDRDYFIRLRDDSKAGLAIAKPVVSRMSGKWVLNMARRINRADGSFAGVVFAQLTIDLLSKSFSSIDVGKKGVVTMRDANMGIIARYPELNVPDKGIGQKLISPQLAEMISSGMESGTYFTPSSSIDGASRTFSFRKMSRYPFYIFVGRATSDYLDGWRKDAMTPLALLLLFCISTLYSARVIYIRWLRQLLTTLELERSRDELDARVIERTSELKMRNLELDAEIAERKRAEYVLHEQTVLLEQEIGERQIAQEALASKHRQLEELNVSLEQRVQDNVAELRSKDSLMIQQSRRASMGEMINNIAHQWRQPLNNLALLIQSIEFSAKTLSQEELKVEVKKCMEQIIFMSQTIDDFRNFFREDKLARSFSVRQSIARAILLVSASLKNNSVKIIVEPGDDIIIHGYQNEYAQVLLNLLGNARDVLLERKVAEPVILLTISLKEMNAVVTVSDNGGGVPPDYIDRIFDPYFTTKEQGKGTGIGLFMSKTIIEQHMNGNLTVDNKNDGACFRVEIPVKRELIDSSEVNSK